MNYERPELLDRLAAEYVLGTMSRRTRRRFEKLRRTLPSADSAAHAWERRLAPLAGSVSPVKPSPQVWATIGQRIGGSGRSVADTASGWMSWLRPLAGFAFGVVATLGIVKLYPTAVVPVDDIVQERGTLPASYVGLLTDATGAPYVLASSTRHGRLMSIKMLRKVDVPAGKVLQLWALPQEGAPFPLATVPAEGKSTFVMSDTSERLLSKVPRLAVSLEDDPAKPGSAPTQPYLLTGNCVKLW